MPHEIEAKFIGIDKTHTRERLSALGFKLVKHETLMRRKAFHFKKDIESGRSRWARVRDEGDKITMCVKEIIEKNSINGVLDSEVEIDSFENGVFFLKAMGMHESAYQESYREIWEIFDEPSQSVIEIMIDSWPHIKPYIEIEAISEDVVKRCAELLGFNMNDALYGSVSEVYFREHGIDRKKICSAPLITFETPFRELL